MQYMGLLPSYDVLVDVGFPLVAGVSAGGATSPAGTVLVRVYRMDTLTPGVDNPTSSGGTSFTIPVKSGVDAGPTRSCHLGGSVGVVLCTDVAYNDGECTYAVATRLTHAGETVNVGTPTVVFDADVDQLGHNLIAPVMIPLTSNRFALASCGRGGTNDVFFYPTFRVFEVGSTITPVGDWVSFEANTTSASRPFTTWFGYAVGLAQNKLFFFAPPIVEDV